VNAVDDVRRIDDDRAPADARSACDRARSAERRADSPGHPLLGHHLREPRHQLTKRGAIADGLEVRLAGDADLAEPDQLSLGDPFGGENVQLEAQRRSCEIVFEPAPGATAKTSNARLAHRRRTRPPHPPTITDGVHAPPTP
jgi:hypothetical protein